MNNPGIIYNQNVCWCPITKPKSNAEGLGKFQTHNKKYINIFERTCTSLGVKTGQCPKHISSITKAPKPQPKAAPKTKAASKSKGKSKKPAKKSVKVKRR